MSSINQTIHTLNILQYKYGGDTIFNPDHTLSWSVPINSFVDPNDPYTYPYTTLKLILSKLFEQSSVSIDAKAGNYIVRFNDIQKHHDSKIIPFRKTLYN